MADKEFTQICKEILGIGKRLEKIEPEELREIKASIERLSEAFNASKALFDESKSDFDGKYNKVAQIVVTFDALKAQIEEVLRSGVIDDNVEGLISTFSSKKIVDLFSNTKATLSTLTNALEAKIDTSLKGVANGVATLNNGGTLEITQIPPQVVTIDNFGALVADTVNTEGFTLGYYVNKDKIVQELGEHKDLIMSQKAVNDALKTNVMPVGSYMLFSSNTNTPDGFLRCDGSALDKTAYAALFAVIGYTYGRSGDKFLLPNFSDGKFMRSIGGNAAALGTAQQDAIRNITGEIQTDRAQIQSARGVFKGPLISAGAGINGTNIGIGRNFDFDASRVVPTANENRPYNMAVVVLIKY